MLEITFFMYFNAVAAFIIAELTALLPLRYPNHNPFLTIPSVMVVLVISTIMYYMLQIGIILFPRSHFATVAKHLTLFFAYAAVSSLVAALFPAPRATTFIYTIFALLVAGQALFVFGVFAVEDDRVVDEDERFAIRFRRYIRMLARGVVGFFRENTTHPL